ncbi:MAG: DNA-directed RNA polymerases I and III subunit RPAC1 [Cirrosporium novae-zelandiae]|nr:MAG: DNA-directed RNA polymerases I and III subunit RPAC1 [Cirrosporium novae-zelandiae]KAI9735636.1 MAG: DNA-directed RNA polymerases I and III subunit RPAC1 [Cirrosporium novae-zelandiae]
MAPLQPSQAELDRRKIVGITPERVTHVSSTDYPGHYPGEDHSWNLSRFAENFQIQFHFNNPLEASFSLIGIDAAIANAFRRILIAEVPTLAIEHVYIHNNTSIIQDEVLAHRLGLIPLKGSPVGLDWMEWFQQETPTQPASTPSDRNTIVLKLKATCTRNPSAPKKETDPKILYNNAHVYANQIEFHAASPRQLDKFPAPDGIIQPVNPDILIAKMRPGQEIDIDMHCIKGIGADHAKFSPVATASYRLLPTITIKQPILGKDARKFARCFPKGVIALEPVTPAEAATPGSGYEGHQGDKKAVVKDTFRDTVSRECLRHEEFQGKVELGRVRDHFIFSVESTGQMDSERLFLEAVKTLKIKCERLKRNMVCLRG